MKARSLLLFPLLGGLAFRAAAQLPPLGPEFQVNTDTPYIYFSPAVACDSQSNFVVVWENSPTSADIAGQRFDWLGARVGTEFAVNTYTTDSQRQPAVAATGNGAFVVVWQSAQDGSGLGIFGQRFGVKASPFPFLPGQFMKFGPEFQVNTYTTREQSLPSVSADRAGNFVVVWNSRGQIGSEPAALDIFGQRFDSSGNKVGAEFQVNTYTTSDQVLPAVASAADGSFVVVWQSFQDGSGSGIFGQRFDTTGNKVGGEFQVNTYTTNEQGRPSISSTPDGHFVVVWESNGQHGSSVGIFGQKFDNVGNRLGPEFQVNTYTTGPQRRPSIALASDRSFVVVWENKFFSSDGISAKLFNRSGDPEGGEFEVSAFTASYQGYPRVANDGTGFVVAWRGYGQGGSGYHVVARRVDRIPVGLSVDSRPAGGTLSDSNGVFEPGERVLVAPEWTNRSSTDFGDFGGTVWSFFGWPFEPGGLSISYSVHDSSADYGAVPAGALGACDHGSADACYQVSVGRSRPFPHWDTSLEESVSAGSFIGHGWTLHVGDSFTDVPRSQPFYKKIETILHHGITSGCNVAQYCPGQTVTRDQMAIFIAKALAARGNLIPSRGILSGISFGSSYNCTAGGNSLFTDVAPTDQACKHIHYLAAQNVTLGCGNFKYCPAPAVTRDAMASFVAKAIVAPAGGDGVPVSFSGPSGSYSCDPLSPSTHFTDVPATHPFCKHIHFLWAKGIVSGCSATQYCPSAPVARDAMAKFIANGFGLELYGP